MGTVYNGKLIAKGMKFCIIVSRFNEFISRKLVDGCLDMLTRHETDENNIDICWVPGSFEIPLAAQKCAAKGYDAVICLGALIRGDTPHFDYIAAEVSKGIAQVSLQSGIPAIFGVITADSLEQAIERAGAKGGNKGADAALSAIEMANLFRQIK